VRPGEYAQQTHYLNLVLKNHVAILLMHTLFNICFDKGVVPSIGVNVVYAQYQSHDFLIRKIPLSYRCIVLASSVYKLYCA